MNSTVIADIHHLLAVPGAALSARSRSIISSQDNTLWWRAIMALAYRWKPEAWSSSLSLVTQWKADLGSQPWLVGFQVHILSNNIRTKSVWFSGPNTSPLYKTALHNKEMPFAEKPKLLGLLFQWLFQSTYSPPSHCSIPSKKEKEKKKKITCGVAY